MVRLVQSASQPNRYSIVSGALDDAEGLELAARCPDVHETFTETSVATAAEDAPNWFESADDYMKF